MAVNVNGYPLEWDAVINTDNFTASTKTIEDNLSAVLKKGESVNKVFNDFEKVTNKISELTAEIDKMKTPEFLQGKTPERIKEINQYIEQQERLISDLKEVASEYRKELEAIGKTPVEAPKPVPAEIPLPKKVEMPEIISKQVLDELKTAFGEIDAPTQEYIKTLIALEIKLRELQNTQESVAEAFNSGRITEQQYVDTTASIIGGIKAVTEESDRLTDKQKEYEASLRNSNGSINEKRQALKGLQQAYASLSDAQRKSPEGKQMAADIASLSQEIKGLDPTKIKETESQVVSIRTQLQQLTEQMARNPNSPLFGEWKKQAGELRESLASVKEGIEQATNSTAGIEAFASGLRGIVGGFTAVTGVVGLFTDDTEEVEKVTKNAASALALLNGIQEVSNVLQKTSALNVYLLGLAKKGATVATVAETVATEANTVATGVNVAATEAQTVATETATVASRGLSAALLANPAALVIGAIAALAATILILRSNSDKTTASQKAFNETIGDLSRGLADAGNEVNKVNNAFDLYHSGLVSRDKALKAYNDTLGEAMGYTDDLAVAEKNLADKADVYIQVQGLKAQANAMFALSAQKAAQQVENSNKDTLNWFDKFKAGFTDGNFFRLQADYTKANARKQQEANKQLQQEQDALEQRAKYQMALAGQLAKNANINADLLDQGNEERSKNESNRNKKLEDEQRRINDLIKERQSLLESIDSLKEGAKDTDLSKEESEIEKVNKKYDEAITKITEYNKKVEEFNKGRKNKIAGISSEDISKLEAARQTEIDNTVAKQRLENYKKQLSEQKSVFEAYEQAKNEIGEKYAKQLFASQTKGADSYLDFLQKQEEGLKNIVSTSVDSSAVKSAQLQLKENAEEQQKENERLQKKNLDKQSDDLKTLLSSVVTYREKQLSINKHYDELEKTARENSSTPQELSDRLAIIQQMREDDLNDLKNNLARQSDLYRMLGEDIITFSREQLKTRVNFLSDALKNETLTPEAKAAVKNVINQYKGLLDDTDEGLQNTLELSDKFDAVAQGISNVGSSLEGVNEVIKQVIGTLSAVGSAVGTTLKSLAVLKSQSATTTDKIGAGFGIFGAFTSVVGAINGIINAGAERRARLKAEEDAWMLDIKKGEISINDEYRARALLQARINKLRIDGLNEEADALANNRKSLEEDYKKILSLLQKEGKIARPEGYTPERIEEINNLRNWAPYDKTVLAFDRAVSLADKSFDDLQKLFLEGRLDEKATQLFQTLEQLKKQGLDVDAQLAENKKKMDELFTGTASESILDSIVKGFADGKRAVKDFADDFQQIMKNAILNSFKYKALEKPIQDFYDQFAAAAQSDDTLTQAEILQLQAQYDAIIKNAGIQFDQLTKLTGIDLGSDGQGGNSLKGAVKGITEQQADLLAGQFGGLRITAMEQLQTAKASFLVLNKIENNTSRIAQVESYLRKFEVEGIKIR